ncbi:osmoprotectant transport system substrate-binding protein [Trichococcus ilyis]|uniref:Osmoprotectant transport system substrate-binding protein n=1 Tax=Trichococcus ilyis TaxID=640938 RepID=A0A143ZAI0_9LACT|nr:Hypothetical protein TR210_2768 [Trichococcus ilyis]SEJ88849.1 osmoprotectant transport system substrate-binding protein [Trichococcus ilyis]
MKRKNIFTTIAMLAVALIISGCSGTSGESGSSEEDTVIRVGSKDFTENLLVSEIYALALEDAGYEVERIPGIASYVVHTSITNDEIDLYPEYTGTGLLAILKMDLETDPQKVYDTVKAEYDEQFDMTWLDYTQANDSAGLVIKTSVAEKYGIETVSDLQEHASELRFASQGEFDQREDGLPGLTKAYGEFKWKSSTVYDNSLKYEILKNDEADVDGQEYEAVAKKYFDLIN